MDKPKFRTGEMVITPAAIAALDRNGDRFELDRLMARHLAGDWGEMSDEDKRSNDDGLKTDDRLHSAYSLKDGTKIWIITECDRSVTTALLPEDY